MAEHENVCARKKVILAGRVAKGSSIKKILVKEAELCAAKTVVVGANRSFSFCGSAYLAKYCARKLPSTVSLIAVHRGNIIFQKPATELKLSSVPQAQHLRSFLHPNIGMNSELSAPRSRKLFPDKGKKIAKQMMNESMDYCIVFYDKMSESNRNSVPVLARKLSERKHGWPLLCKAFTANVETLKDCEARKLSVVQWAMKLPNRSLSFTTKPQADLSKDLELILGLNSSTCKFFQYEELQNSTNYFSQERLIGKGGNSEVYFGCLQNGQQVAIKVSKLSEKSSRDFLLEVDIVTRLQHDCILPLIGICVQNDNPISIYSYFSRGNLEENLHGKRAKTPLDWNKRFKVAVGVAEALSYLHCDCSRPVIHRDVKSSNILLSDECKPKLSDFGLAIWGPTATPYLTHSDVVGTFGYLAPEYFMYGKVSAKIDVYAFGVVLLELLTGRKPINDKSPKGQESLIMWAAPLLKRGDFLNLLDPNLDGIYEEDQLKRLACAALLCIKRSARHRPHMNQILELLQGEQEIEPWMSSNTNYDHIGQDCQDEEAYPASSIGSHISLALRDVDDDASVISFEQNHLNSLDEFLRDRWSRSSSFD